MVRFEPAGKNSPEVFEPSRPFNLWGKVWEIASLSPDGLQLKLRRGRTFVEPKTSPQLGFPSPRFSATGIDGKSIDLQREASAQVCVVGFLGRLVPTLPR